MATSTIKGGIETFAPTRTNNTVSGDSRGFYDRASGLVRLYLCFGTNANIDVETAIFTIPKQYCPSTTVTGMGMIHTATASGWSNYHVLPSGVVRQRNSNACRGGFAVIEYPLR